MKAVVLGRGRAGAPGVAGPGGNTLLAQAQTGARPTSELTADGQRLPVAAVRLLAARAIRPSGVRQPCARRSFRSPGGQFDLRQPCRWSLRSPDDHGRAWGNGVGATTCMGQWRGTNDVHGAMAWEQRRASRNGVHGATACMEQWRRSDGVQGATARNDQRPASSDGDWPLGQRRLGKRFEATLIRGADNRRRGRPRQQRGHL
jgi:hypothetical protein